MWVPQTPIRGLGNSSSVARTVAYRASLPRLKPNIYFGTFAAVRVKILTYQSCPDTKRQKTNVNKQPQVLRLTTPRLKSAPGAPFAQDDKQKQKQVQKQPQVLRLTTPRLKSAPGAPFAQDDKLFWCCAYVAQDDRFVEER